MKKIFFVTALLYSIISFGQVPQGGDRVCGSEFAPYGLAGMTLKQAVDWAGQTHNDYQEDLLRKLDQIKPNFTDTVSLKRIVAENSDIFFKSRGLKYDENVHTLNLGRAVVLELQSRAYSQEAYALMNQLQNQLNSFDENNSEFFISTLKTMKENALNLSDEKEVFTVGVPISVAIHSFSYWKINGQRWLDTFTAYDQAVNVGNSKSTSITPSSKTKPKVSLVKVGGADVVGAVNGAVAGAAMGPGGALAGGVLISAVSSLGNLANQIISHYASWWPF